tara:strand:- start:311 stop:529 length:219 start_codon:yes stop_codon:yes gene_type:complete
MESHNNGGWGGIRTHGGREPSLVFKTSAFNRSATHPRVASVITTPFRFGESLSYEFAIKIFHTGHLTNIFPV